MYTKAKVHHALGVAFLLSGVFAAAADAQENRNVLPTIDVSSSRLIPDIVGQVNGSYGEADFR